MGFEDLLELGEKKIAKLEYDRIFNITLNLRNDTIEGIPFEALFYLDQLEEELGRLIKYAYDTKLEIIFRDVLLIERNERSIKPYFLDIKIEMGDKFKKVSSFTINTFKPNKINDYETKFFSTFDDFEKGEKNF